MILKWLALLLAFYAPHHHHPIKPMPSAALETITLDFLTPNGTSLVQFIGPRVGYKWKIEQIGYHYNTGGAQKLFWSVKRNGQPISNVESFDTIQANSTIGDVTDSVINGDVLTRDRLTLEQTGGQNNVLGAHNIVTATIFGINEPG